MTKKELSVFASVFDGSDEWLKARLPELHAGQLVEVLSLFDTYPKKISMLGDDLISSMMWHETYAQNDGIIERNVHFPASPAETVYSGPHIGIANPLVKTSRAVCKNNSDYDVVDLTNIKPNYIQRCNYTPIATIEKICNALPNTKWGKNYYYGFKLASRAMLNISGERSLISCIIPEKSMHINAIMSLETADELDLVSIASAFASIPFDYYIKATGMNNLRITTVNKMPLIKNEDSIIRYLRLVCLTEPYASLWEKLWNDSFSKFNWAKKDSRLTNDDETILTRKWNSQIAIRSDFARRQALIEIDVLTAMEIGMTIDQLKTIYRIQFPVLRSYEDETWYDANGRIVFTNNRSLIGVGFDRREWENGIKGATSGQKFYRTINDDTVPGGPVERTIEYVAPFDRCDREQDYETAWRFFEEKYGKK